MPVGNLNTELDRLYGERQGVKQRLESFRLTGEIDADFEADLQTQLDDNYQTLARAKAEHGAEYETWKQSKLTAVAAPTVEGAGTGLASILKKAGKGALAGAAETISLPARATVNLLGLPDPPGGMTRRLLKGLRTSAEEAPGPELAGTIGRGVGSVAPMLLTPSAWWSAPTIAGTALKQGAMAMGLGAAEDIAEDKPFSLGETAARGVGGAALGAGASWLGRLLSRRGAGAKTPMQADAEAAAGGATTKSLRAADEAASIPSVVPRGTPEILPETPPPVAVLPPGQAIRQRGRAKAVPKKGEALGAPGAAPEGLRPAPPSPAVPPVHEVPPTDLPKYAGSVNLSRLRTPDDVKRVILEASAAAPPSKSFRFEEVVQAAHEMGGMSVEEAVTFARSGRPDVVNMLRARETHVGLAEVAEQAKRAWRQTRTPDAMAAWNHAWQNELSTFEAAQTIARRSGQALGSFRIEAGPNAMTNARMLINRTMLEMQGGKFQEEASRRLLDVDMTDPRSVQAFLRWASTATATPRQKLFEAWMASILSGPLTHAVNTASNTLFLAMSPLERLGTAALELRRVPGARERFFGEAGAEIYGAMSGLKEAGRVFLRTMAGEATESLTKLDPLGAAGPKIAGRAGEVIRTPLRLLAATDDFFKALVRRGDLHAQAYRQAIKEGVAETALPQRIAELIEQPTKAMMEHADAQAVYRTFQRALGPAGRAVFTAREALPGLEYIIPFIRTPVNIAKTALERTPLNAPRVLVQALQGKLDPAGVSEEGAKVIVGSMLGGMVALWAAEGQVTGGGPVDREARQALQATGWQPYSVKIGDEYYSYARLEPVGTVLAMAADFAETLELQTEQERQMIATKIMRSLVRNFGDKTFLSGLNGVMQVISDPDRYGDRWIQHMAGSAVAPALPSIVAQAARASDPYYRDVRTTLDAIKSRVPGERGTEGLPPKRDYLGDPIRRPGTFWTRFLSPVQVSTDRDDPLRRRVQEVGAQLALPKRTIRWRDQSIRLTPEEYDMLQVHAGQYAKRLLGPLAEGSVDARSAPRVRDALEKRFARAHHLALQELRPRILARVQAERARGEP